MPQLLQVVAQSLGSAIPRLAAATALPLTAAAAAMQVIYCLDARTVLHVSNMIVDCVLSHTDHHEQHGVSWFECSDDDCGWLFVGF